MFKDIFLFELKSWLRKPMIYIFFVINFLMIFFAASSDSMSIGVDVSNLLVNAPYSIMSYSVFMSLIAVVMTTAFVNNAALRDFTTGFEAIIFSAPIVKRDYLLGRFLSSYVVSVLPLLGVFLGLLLAPYNSVAVEQVGPVYWGAYLNSFLLFILPNTFLIAAVIFGLAIWFKSTTASFIGSLAILIGYLMTDDLMTNQDMESLVMYFDPFGINVLNWITKYWTVHEKNTMFLGLSGPMLINRLIWMVVAITVFLLSYWKFSFAKKNKKSKKLSIFTEGIDRDKFQVLETLSVPTINAGWKSSLKQLWSFTLIETLNILKSPAFIVISLFAVLNMANAISFSNSTYGGSNFPLTYIVLSKISSSLFAFIIVLVAYYTGVLVWHQRAVKMDELIDASPIANWIPGLAKYNAMAIMVAVLLLISIVLGVVIQSTQGYYHFELGLYFRHLFLIDYPLFLLMIAISFFIQHLVNNMYLGFFVFIVFTIANAFIWPALGINSNLVIASKIPAFTYSDMYGYAPWTRSLFFYNGYWVLVAGILVVLSLLFVQRGKVSGVRNRLGVAFRRMSKSFVIVFLSLGVVWMATAGFLYYNAEVLNENLPESVSESRSANYEKLYKKFDGIPQPRFVELDHQIDLYPEERNFESRTTAWIKNKHDHAIDSLHFSIPSFFEMAVNIPEAKLVLNDSIHQYRIYKLEKPLQAGDSMHIVIRSDYHSKGIENQLSLERINQNGSFMENNMFMPVMGYDLGFELSGKDDRKEHGLPAKERMHGLHAACSHACGNTPISTDADWVRMKSTLSTSLDQTAIAPGSLVKEWTEGKRRYFSYQLDKPVLNFYAFLSARYEVQREKWNGVDLEVYYHKGHEYNVDKMMQSMRKSLAYNSDAFLTYPHKQARIIEFPRYANFAQAFPGTMPYSESMGFIADLKSESSIDKVFYFVAHEMAHQWWGHQVVGAQVQGTHMLVESFAQYSALMVMEQEYGKEKMQRFLRYEMDLYLRRRSEESTKEMPLMQVEDQGYIHYQKGSVVMYAMKEYLGEETLNLALRNFAEQNAYQEPPYSTSNLFMSELEKVTPDSLRYLVDDMFKKIVLYQNRLEEVELTELDNGRFELTLKVKVQKFEADEKGVEQQVAINDYIHIGVYAEAGDNAGLGKPLYYKSHKIDQEETEINIVVAERPFEAGIDPLHLLIDRIPDDNLKSIN